MGDFFLSSSNESELEISYALVIAHTKRMGTNFRALKKLSIVVLILVVIVIIVVVIFVIIVIFLFL